jgi:hypothetical protein
LDFSLISAVAVFHGSQAKVFPHGSAFVIGTKQPSALQFGNNHLDEILATTGQRGGCDVETIASRFFDPLLHDIGNVSGRTDGVAQNRPFLGDRRRAEAAGS